MAEQTICENGAELKMEIWQLSRLADVFQTYILTAKMLDLTMHVIYHTTMDGRELANMTLLEALLKGSGLPYELTILFDKDDNARRRVVKA